MNPLRLLCALAGLLAAASLPAQPFEGRIKMQMKEGGRTMNMDYAVKKDLVRIDLPIEQGMTASSILLLAKKEVIMLMPGQPMYLVMPLQDVADQATARAAQTSPLEKTGDTETILGYACTKYVTRDREGVTEIWAAEGIGTFMGLSASNPMQPAPRNAWETELMKTGFFPLRIVGRTAAGHERFRLDVTAMEKQSLADSLFAPPAGYQRLEMGGMMKGALPGNPFGGR